ncbi:MAG: AMP-binding protein, partial [Chloroflexota bacterium]
MLLGEILRKNARPDVFGGKTALIFGDRSWTYSALNAEANRITNGLLALGVTKGDRVAVLGRNSDVYIAIYFALAKLGAIMVPVNFWYRAEEIRYTLEQSGSRWLIADSRFNEVASAARARLPNPVTTIWYEPTADRIDPMERGNPEARSPRLASPLHFQWRGAGGEAATAPLQTPASDPEGQHTDPPGFTLDSLIASAPTTEPDVAVSPEDPHIILYTSGTTGFPKGATFSHRAHYLHAVALALQTGQTSDDVGIVIYPLFHTGGPDCLVLPHFLVGATIVVQDGADPVAILTAAERHRLTNIFCVPTVWRWILAELAQHPYDVSSVRRCLGSSDTLPPDLLSGILDRFAAEVRVTYGLTEAGCILTYSRLTRDDRAKIHTVGRPHPLVEVRVVDPGGQDVAIGEVGEIVARGPMLMDGYWNLPERTAETLAGDWLHSGDLGSFDEDGYLIIAGRLKDMIVSGGEKIYPVEVERLLKEHPKIRDAALVGVPDPEWGQAVLAVIAPEPGADLTENEVIDYVGTHLAGYKRPRYVELVDALPTTTAT